MVVEEGVHIIARNRKARHDFEILEEIEAGIVLAGAEVKSLREGRASFTDSYARVEDAEVWLFNLHITPYESAQFDVPDPKRPRKLLLHRRQIKKLRGLTAEAGLTLVPLDLHFRRGYAKVMLGVARGRTRYDKREALKRKQAGREVDRAIRDARKD